MDRQVLIAGIGNIFLGDDAFGVEVVRCLAHRVLSERVKVIDYGIRGLDLAYALVDGWDAVILVDAAPRGRAPGTLYVIEPELQATPTAPPNPAIDGHQMDPLRVLHLAASMGAALRNVLVVACEPSPLVPIVCVPGCPVQPDNYMETLLYLLRQASGSAPMIPLDEMLRPTWLFSPTVHEGCDRGGRYEQAQFAEEYGNDLCIVKLGCWGPVVQCNVGKRGWMAGIGGCPNVGGVCIGCTMPGFPDKFMPFLDEPPGAKLSTRAVSMYGKTVHALRGFTQASMNREPEWRRPDGQMTNDESRKKPE